MKSKSISVFSLTGLLVASAQFASVAKADGVLGDIVRYPDDNSIRLMRLENADRYCQAHGSRLPTQREYALYAQSLGAKGIMETDYPGVSVNDPMVQAEIQRMDLNGYYVIYVDNEVGEPASVDFYFSEIGYQRPDDETFGFLWFWTSSNYLPAFFDSGHGMLSSYSGLWGLSQYNAVRCMIMQ